MIDDGWNCETCKGIETTGGTPPNCQIACPMPLLMDENFEAWDIFQKVASGLFDGFGGINLTNLKIILDEYGIKRPSERQNIMDKIMALAAEMRKKKDTDG